MHYEIYYNRYDNDKTKFTDIIITTKKQLQKLQSIAWITICHTERTGAPCGIIYSVYSIFNSTVMIEEDISKIKPIFLKEWIGE